MKPTIKIVNVETGEEIEREMTDAEFSQHQADLENAALIKEQIKAKETQRQELLDKLGITEEEAKLLLG